MDEVVVAKGDCTGGMVLVVMVSMLTDVVLRFGGFVEVWVIVTPKVILTVLFAFVSVQLYVCGSRAAVVVGSVDGVTLSVAMTTLRVVVSFGNIAVL